MSQCVLGDIRWVPHKGRRAPVGLGKLAESLGHLRSRYGRTGGRQDAVTTCIVLLVGSHDRDLFGNTRPMEAAEGKAKAVLIDTFACHGSTTNYGVTVYQVW